MDNWKDLSLTKKIVIGVVIVIAASFAPELMILVDIGGIDLAFGFLVFYFKPLIEWIKCKKEAVVGELKIARAIILNSTLAKPKVFTVNAIYCTVFMLLTGSLLFSFSFFLPALFVSGIYV